MWLRFSEANWIKNNPTLRRLPDGEGALLILLNGSALALLPADCRTSSSGEARIPSSIVMASQVHREALHSCGLHHLPLEDRERHEVPSGAGGVTGHRRQRSR